VIIRRDDVFGAGGGLRHALRAHLIHPAPGRPRGRHRVSRHRYFVTTAPVASVTFEEPVEFCHQYVKSG